MYRKTLSFLSQDTPSFPGLAKFFTVGSLVQCSVLETEGPKPGKKKIKLSVDPKELNSGITKLSLKQGMVSTCRIDNHWIIRDVYPSCILLSFFIIKKSIQIRIAAYSIIHPNMFSKKGDQKGLEPVVKLGEWPTTMYRTSALHVLIMCTLCIYNEWQRKLVYLP